MHRIRIGIGALGLFTLASCQSRVTEAPILSNETRPTSLVTPPEVIASSAGIADQKKEPTNGSEESTAPAESKPEILPQDVTPPAAPPVNIPDLPQLNPDDAPSVMGTPVSLAVAWTKIRAHYPLLKKQHARLDEELAQQSLAVSGLLPRARIGINATQTNDPVGVFGAKLRQESFSQEDFAIDRLNHPDARANYGAFARVEWPLFDAFQTIASIRTSKHRVQSVQEQERFTTMESALLTIESYNDVILTQRLDALAWQTALDSQNDLHEASDLMRQGLMIGADFYSARTKHARLRQAHHTLKSRAIAALATFNILQGEPATRPLRVAGPFTAGKTISTKKQADWLREAFLFRSDLAAVRSSLRAQESELGREKATLLPRISAFGEVQKTLETWRRTPRIIRSVCRAPLTCSIRHFPPGSKKPGPSLNKCDRMNLRCVIPLPNL